jgi:hypothetical protein
MNASFTALRAFARTDEPAPSDVERCELCLVRIPGRHDHLLERPAGRLCCACGPCAQRFSISGNTRGSRAVGGGSSELRYRRIESRFERLPGFRLDDTVWAQLRIPIGVAFFVPQDDGQVAARFPSPAGATASQLALEDWRKLAADNPVLDELTPEVEALLVYHLGEARRHYRVSLDTCYRLVGLVRRNWRGLSGGEALWTAVDEFFAEADPETTVEADSEADRTHG